MQEEYDSTGDRELHCVKCDRFVESIDKDGFCPQCASEEKHEKEMWECAK